MSEIFDIVVSSVQAVGRVRHHDVAATCGENPEKSRKSYHFLFCMKSARRGKKITLRWNPTRLLPLRILALIAPRKSQKTAADTRKSSMACVAEFEKAPAVR